MIYEIEDTTRIPDTAEDVLSLISQVIREEHGGVVSKTESSLEFSSPVLEWNRRPFPCVSSGIISLETEGGQRCVRYRLSLSYLRILCSIATLVLICGTFTTGSLDIFGLGVLAIWGILYGLNRSITGRYFKSFIEKIALTRLSHFS